MPDEPAELYRVTVRFSGKPPPPYPGVHQFITRAYVEAKDFKQAERYALATLRKHCDPTYSWEVLKVERGAFVGAT